MTCAIMHSDLQDHVLQVYTPCHGTGVVSGVRRSLDTLTNTVPEHGVYTHSEHPTECSSEWVLLTWMHTHSGSTLSTPS